MAKKPLAPDRHGDYWWVDSRRLVEEDGFNRREDYGDIPKLAREIKAAGLNNLDPLICYKKGELYVILKGHRRNRALKILEEDGEILIVRILLAQKGYKKEDMILDQATGNEGKQFTPWEKSKVVRDLRGLGWSEKDMVERSGWSNVYVKRLLSLADAPQQLINLVREKRVSGTFAMEMIAEGKVEELLEKAEKNELPFNSELEMFPRESAAAKPAKITKLDIQRPPSYKKINTWRSRIDTKGLSAKKLEVYEFLGRLLEGQVSEDDFKEYFEVKK